MRAVTTMSPVSSAAGLASAAGAVCAQTGVAEISAESATRAPSDATIANADVFETHDDPPNAVGADRYVPGGVLGSASRCGSFPGSFSFRDDRPICNWRYVRVVASFFACTVARLPHFTAPRYVRFLMKLIIGNKAYSSWSLRGWLACKQSGFALRRSRRAALRLPNGTSAATATNSRRPRARCRSCGTATRWCGTASRSSNISPRKTSRDLFWPDDPAARAMARSMAAEMHSSFTALRRKHSMNVRQIFPPAAPR